MSTGRAKRDAGFVLVCVLWVIALLTVLTLGFGRRATLDRRAAAYTLDHTVAMSGARGAVERGILEIANRGIKMRLLRPDQRGGTHLGEEWASVKNLYEEGVFEETEGLEDDQVSYIITDEDRLVNVNAAPRELLEELDALSRTLVRRIMARRENEERAGEGVSLFQAVEELRYLRGLDDEDWFGEDGEPGLKDLMTVWGDARINVNTAPRAVLEALPRARKGDLDAILQYRAGPDGESNTRDDQGFRDMDDLSQKTGVQGVTREALDKYCKCDSMYFKITGFATRRKGRIRAVCSAVVVVSDGMPLILDWQEKTLGS